MPDEMSVAFGQVVRRRREAAGLSQEEYAFKSDIDRSYVSRVELGKVKLGLMAAKKFANGLGVSLSDLIAEAEAELREE